MPPKETSNHRELFIFNKCTGKYEKFCDTVESLSTFNPDEPEQDVVMGFDLSSDREFTGTFTLKNPVVADAEYKEVNK